MCGVFAYMDVSHIYTDIAHIYQECTLGVWMRMQHGHWKNENKSWMGQSLTGEQTDGSDSTGTPEASTTQDMQSGAFRPILSIIYNILIYTQTLLPGKNYPPALPVMPGFPTLDKHTNCIK